MKFCQERCLFCVIYNIYAKQTQKSFKNIERLGIF